MKNSITPKACVLITILLGAIGGLTSCDAMWDTSVGVGTDGIDYGVSVYPGTVYPDPWYWGSDYYPGIGYYPPLAGSLPGPVRPGAGYPNWGNRPIGNVRPPAFRPQPVNPLPGNGNGNGNVRPGTSVTPLPGIPPQDVTGGEPGIALPPSGSGMRPGRH